MTTLDDAVALARGESGLAVVSTVRADGTVQASLVNVGLLPHPASVRPVTATATRANRRRRPPRKASLRNHMTRLRLSDEAPAEQVLMAATPFKVSVGTASARRRPRHAGPIA